MSQVSAFRKKRSVSGSRSPSPLVGLSKDNQISGQHLSNQSQNYVSSLQKGKEKNENLMNSLLKDEIFDDNAPVNKDNEKYLSDLKDKSKIKQKPNDVLNFEVPSDFKRQSMDQPRDSVDITDIKRASEINNSIQPNRTDNVSPNYSFHEKQNAKDKEAKGKLNNQFQDEINQKLSLIDQSVSKGPSFQEQILAIKDNETIDQNFYKNNMNLVLTIVALKKIILRLHTDNVELKKEKNEYELREYEYQNKIRKLEASIDELRLKEKLWEIKPSEYIKFDLEDLDSKLKNIDESLDKVTNDNLQANFLEDIVIKNKEYLSKNEENSNSLKQLKDNLGNLKATLIAMNKS